MGSINRAKERFVVGIDFGTTFTSAAFAHSSAPDVVNLVITWPNCGIGRASAEYVPTVVHYTNPRTGAKQWGNEVVNANSAENLRWFKLLLQPKSNKSPQEDTYLTGSAKPLPSLFDGLKLSENAFGSPVYAPDSRTNTPADETEKKLQELNISPMTVVSDFLKSVLEITKASIEETYGSRIVRDSPVEYILTIPAIWTDSAKDLMVQAAERAGFGKHRDDFNLIGEPESAAVYALKEIRPNFLKKGDTFIVCDAGGGTVDLIAYKIKDMKPLRLDEMVSGTGDLCGSVFLDQGFEEYIRKVVGNKAIDDLKPLSKHRMMESWEQSAKFTFGNMSKDEYFISVPGLRDDEDCSIEDGCHTMEAGDVHDIFDPIVEKIIKLVDEQVVGVQKMGEPVAAILLVGGLGSSTYLFKRLSDEHFGWRSSKVPMLKPPNSRTAVVRGALIQALDGSIVGNRRARRCYGSRSSLARPKDYGEYWDSQQNTWRDDYSDMEDYMKWDHETDTWRASGYLNWYIRKNDVVGETHSERINFFRTVPIPAVPGDFIFKTPLFSCELEDPPAFKWMNPNALTRVFTLYSDLSEIPLSKFKKTTNSRGDSFYEVNYTLRVTLLKEVLKFDRLVGDVVYGESTKVYGDST